MPRMRYLVCAVVLLVATPCAAQDKIRVFLTAPTRDGFVDTSKDIQDSLGDVRKRLLNMKELAITPTRDTADVVLTVVSRGVGSHVYGQRLNIADYYGNTSLTHTAMVSNTYWVSAVMDVGQYRKEVLGTYVQDVKFSAGAWGDCAKDIAQEVRSWVLANSEAVRKQRR